jgi:hypothetical protein
MIDESLSGLASRFFFRETGKAEVAGVLECGIAITRAADGGLEQDKQMPCGAVRDRRERLE